MKRDEWGGYRQDLVIVPIYEFKKRKCFQVSDMVNYVDKGAANRKMDRSYRRWYAEENKTSSKLSKLEWDFHIDTCHEATQH